MKPPRPTLHEPAAALALALALGACGSIAPPESAGPPAREEIVAVSVSNQLLRFNAGQPQQLREKRPLSGLATGETLLGIDYRVARGVLYALGASGQLYKIDVGAAKATASGTACTVSTGTGMRPVGSVSSAKRATAWGSAA